MTDDRISITSSPVILLLLCRVSRSGGLLLTPEMSVFLSLECLIAEKQIWLGDRILCAMFFVPFSVLTIVCGLSCLRFSKIFNLKQICQAQPQFTFCFGWMGWVCLISSVCLYPWALCQSGLDKKIADSVQISIQRRMFSVYWFWVFFKRRLVTL